MKALVERAGEALARRGLRLVTAESCTGGLMAAAFIDRPGASRFFHAGLVTYSDAAKTELLGVQPGTLADHGAVAEAVAREMVRGARERGDVGVAITGIAGPDGGTVEKPVGTVWIAVATAETESAERFHFDGDRTRVREDSVEAALGMLVAALEDA
jgi:nicotinamide-nucleotide amidase